MKKIDNILEVMKSRHSVRHYTDRKIEENISSVLFEEIKEINEISGLHFDLCLEEPNVYKANKPHYGSFKGCRNYFVCFGPKGADEQVGYYGEHLVLLAQSLGLNTCWCALTFEKSQLPVSAPEGMVLHDVIALGYGETQGEAHKSKSTDKVAKITENTEEWFKKGVEAALLAPTGLNQQKFYIEQTEEGKVLAKTSFGICTKTDLGIVKYHFEKAAGKENFEWEE